MRTIKELLKVMLENQHLFEYGLCQWALNLKSHEIISYDESETLFSYIRANRPSMFSSLSAFKHRGGGYYWEENKISYRIKWINKHIKKLS